jgi:hypothetical protein
MFKEDFFKKTKQFLFLLKGKLGKNKAYFYKDLGFNIINDNLKKMDTPVTFDFSSLFFFIHWCFS